MTEAVLNEFGVVRARTTEEMLDIAHTATRRIYPARNTLGVLTVSGGAGVLISDVAEQAWAGDAGDAQAGAGAAQGAGLLLRDAQSGGRTAQVSNDMTLITKFFGELEREGGYSSVLAFFSQVAASRRGPLLREKLAEVVRQYPDRLHVLSVITPPGSRAASSRMAGRARRPDAGRGRHRGDGPFRRLLCRRTRPAAAHSPRRDAAGDDAHRGGGQAAARRGGDRLGARAGLRHGGGGGRGGRGLRLPRGDEDPLAGHSSQIRDRRRVAGRGGRGRVRDGFATLLDRAKRAAPAARIEGVLVAKQLKGGVECILGIHRDPVFGPIAMFGLGGIFVEVLKDVVFRRCPFGEDVAEQMIRSIKGAPLLLGARGRKPADVKALARMLARLSVFAHQVGPSIASIDLNPVFAMPEGEGAFAADAVVEIG